MMTSESTQWSQVGFWAKSGFGVVIQENESVVISSLQQITLEIDLSSI